jgi:hypothetical protein
VEIEVAEMGNLILKKVYNTVEFITEEGEYLFVCMRDGAFEVGSTSDPIRAGGKPPVWYSIGSGEAKKLGN